MTKPQQILWTFLKACLVIVILEVPGRAFYSCQSATVDCNMALLVTTVGLEIGRGKHQLNEC